MISAQATWPVQSLFERGWRQNWKNSTAWMLVNFDQKCIPYKEMLHFGYNTFAEHPDYVVERKGRSSRILQGDTDPKLANKAQGVSAKFSVGVCCPQIQNGTVG